jgi:hypothetical protein
MQFILSSPGWFIDLVVGGMTLLERLGLWQLHLALEN